MEEGGGQVRKEGVSGGRRGSVEQSTKQTTTFWTESWAGSYERKRHLDFPLEMLLSYPISCPSDGRWTIGW